MPPLGPWTPKTNKLCSVLVIFVGYVTFFINVYPRLIARWEMDTNWAQKIRNYRVRHALSQTQLADIIGVAQRTISRWERGEDRPGLSQQKRLRDLSWEPPTRFIESLATAVTHCPAPRALSRGANINLQAISKPAIDKRPSIRNWLGRDLVKIASGVLEEMLDNRELQRSIAQGEISCVVTTSKSVLRTEESDQIDTYQTTINYFHHDGTIYSDAISAQVSDDVAHGYTPIAMDDVCDNLTAFHQSPRPD